jgi:hypothetical protein
MSCYATYSNFGASINTKPVNPLAICAVPSLEAGFNNVLGGSGSLLDPNGSQCQSFMGAYCAQNWDGVCEHLSKDPKRNMPNTLQNCSIPSGATFGPGLGSLLTAGQILIRNAAAERFLKAMSSNCIREYEPFDPTNPVSPLIGKWVANTGGSCSSGGCGRNNCVPIYSVDPATIDRDPVMNKILQEPWIAMDILVNIYNNTLNRGDMTKLHGTKLFQFFQNPEFVKIARSGQYTT